MPLCSVTADTRHAGDKFLEAAAHIPVRVSTVVCGLDQADHVLADLAHDRVDGADVLIDSPGW